MAKYVLLINWTDQGIRNAKDTTKRAQHAQQLASDAGGSLDVLWTIGRYDLVWIGEFPNDEAETTFALNVAAQGAVRTETLRAFTVDEMDAILTRTG